MRLVALGDGMVWSELAAAFPGSGGTYHFYDAVYGETPAGRLLKFLFVWQFLFSGPLEVATGAIGLAQYLGYFFPALDQPAWSWGCARPRHRPEGRLGSSGRDRRHGAWSHSWPIGGSTQPGRLMVVLWVGMLITVAWVIVTGLTHFDAAQAFDFPEDAWRADRRWTIGLGMALAIAMYDYLGYYQVCYLGDEVADAPRTIPRSILISTIADQPGLPRDECRHPRCPALARGGPVKARCERPDAAGPRPWAPRARHGHDHLDGVGVDVRRTAGLQPDSVCLGPGRPFLPILRRDSPTWGFPAPFAAAGQRDGDARVPGRPSDRHRRPCSPPAS